MRVPKYRRNGDGRAFVRYQNRRYYLGRHGTADSLRAYKDFVGRLFHEPTDVVEPNRMTVAQAAEHYLRFAEAYYSQDGRPTQEFVNVRAAVSDLLTIFGTEPVASLGPKSILTMQTQLVGAGYARTTINSRIARVKRCLRWCASRELIPRSVIEGIWTVDGLRRGRTEAIEPEKVRPVAAAHVQSTLPYLSPVVAAILFGPRIAGGGGRWVVTSLARIPLRQDAPLAILRQKSAQHQPPRPCRSRSAGGFR